MDVFSKEKRSTIMSKISGKETKPEIIIRKFLFSKGFRYRKNVSTLPGKPDIILSKYSTVIFVNGCFWHGHKNCKAAKLPSTRRQFWEEKINNNIVRDKRNIAALKNMGWKVIILWQCQFNTKKKKVKLFNSILKRLVIPNSPPPLYSPLRS
ncbi:MAG TPA: DNA mismatch endonuclease Vsr [Bacteroidia bacterium]|nr:DNA mismatch endonuclease Vsr [Bacteroidia bacterium]